MSVYTPIYSVSHLLLRLLLSCFLCTLVSLDSCIITEHQERERLKSQSTSNTMMNAHRLTWMYPDMHTPSAPICVSHSHHNMNNCIIISHLSISWVSLLYWVALGLFHSPPLLSLLCEEASICNLKHTDIIRYLWGLVVICLGCIECYS